jgi:preprotein translocase subunit Sss1
VVVGVVLEGAEIYFRHSSKRKLRRFIGPLPYPPPEPHTPFLAHVIGDIGFVLLIGALVLEQVCHQRMEKITNRERDRLTQELDSTTRQAGNAIKQAAESNERSKQLEAQNLLLRSNVASLEIAVRELARIYDQSTNALAEANARLASIKPLKTRLIDCLNKVDQRIIPGLESRDEVTYSGFIEESKCIELQTLAREPGASEYITVTLASGIGLFGNFNARRVEMTIKHALLK